MSITLGIITSVAIAVGTSCSGESRESEPQRNPLALNVAIEREIKDLESSEGLSKEFIAGLGLAVAEECAFIGISATEIEDVPLEMQTAEFLDGYSMVLDDMLPKTTIRYFCESAAVRIQHTV